MNQALKSGICWVLWDRLCTTKYFGGIGFRKLQNFNLALIAKQGWRLLSNSGSLVARIFKARYFPNSLFLNAHLKSNPSFLWRSIMAAWEVISRGQFGGLD